MKYTCWALSAAVAAAISSSALAQSTEFSGDLRFGYYAFDRDERNGTNRDDGQWRLRARAGLLWTINDTYSVKGRYAARVHHEDNDSEFRLYRGLNGGSSIQPGQSTLDELYVRARYGNWDHRIGRFQSNNRLVGVAAKSFSRTNSTSWDVGWTDGIQSTWRGPNGWNLTGIIERNDKEEGPTNLRRAPLGFDKSESRATYYLALDSRETDGLWAQRSVDITYIPSSLYYNGYAAGLTEDYLGITGRLATQVAIRNEMTLVSGVELAYAPDTPRNAVMNLPGAGDADGFAWQVSINLMDIVPGHSLGFVHGENDAGWLLSTDFGNNASLTEVRYAWRPMSGHLLEARVRQREDLIQQRTALRKRSEQDFYVRYSISI
ncbi:porin [Pseudohongiella sp. O18]|uniref:porin n=1 Tax=Pseudohongiella sp. O18 TaxID=2904248 RepID=UPI001F02EF4A|nr:porin [Pseudohongiella sp. O18]